MKNGVEKVKSLIKHGTKIVGPTIGATLGALIGGPGGAALGGMSGVVVSEIADIANRKLSEMEKVRIGATAYYALVKIKEYIEEGKTKRDDGFFEKSKGSRAAAEEIFEGVLLKAKVEHEEKKARIFGNIFAGLAFSEGFSIGEANHLLRIVENLSYRQICVLALIARKKDLKIILRKDYYIESTNVSSETASILMEIYQMYYQGLVDCKAPSEKHAETLLEWAEITPEHLMLSVAGRRYRSIMSLEDIPERDIRDIVRHLS